MHLSVSAGTSVVVLTIYRFIGPNSTFFKSRSVNFAFCLHENWPKTQFLTVFDRLPARTGCLRESRKIHSRQPVEIRLSRNENKNTGVYQVWSCLQLCGRARSDPLSRVNGKWPSKQSRCNQTIRKHPLTIQHQSVEICFQLQSAERHPNAAGTNHCVLTTHQPPHCM